MDNRYQALMQRIADGECILIDGATGTEVDRRGVPQLQDAWNGGGALSHPDIVCGVHRDYIRHGAEIVISNTFANARQALENAGYGNQFEALNRRGVELAVEARNQEGNTAVLVAGGISHWIWRGSQPGFDQLRSNTAEQAEIMRSAGADLLMLEMMVDLQITRALLEGARQSGLPVWVGLSCKPDSDGVMRLLEGEPLVDAVRFLNDQEVPLVNIMHTQVEFVDKCLDVLDHDWDRPVGVYAHSSTEVDSHWVFDDVISPQDYTAAALRWIERGVQVIGGCCGIGCDHIEAISAVMPRVNPAPRGLHPQA